MEDAMQRELEMYNRCLALPPLTNDNILPLVKGKTEINEFLNAQYALQDREEDKDGMWIENKDLREFLGKEFLELTEQPQHCAMIDDDRLKERLCEYYPDIFWAMYFHDLNEIPVNNYDVTKRKEYIYGHTRRKAQFLQAVALSDLKDENEFWNNYAWNAEHYKYKLRYQTAHNKRNVPEYPTCYVTRVDHYSTWLRNIVNEFVDEDYTYNTDLTKGGMLKLYKENRVWLTKG